MKAPPITALLAALGLACAARAQTRTTCGNDVHEVQMIMSLHHAYATNACECDAWAAVWANSVDIIQAMALGPSSDGCDTCDDDLATRYKPDGDSKSGNPHCLSAAASVAGPLLGDNASAQIGWCCNSGSMDVYSDSRLYDITSYNRSGQAFCQKVELGLASAGGMGHKTFCFCSTPTWLETLSVDLAVDLSQTSAGIPSNTMAVFVSSTRTCGENSSTSQGVYAFLEDGTTNRLGFFADQAFDPTQTGSGPVVDVDDFTLADAVPGECECMTLDLKWEIIARLDGNMNPDADGDHPIVCYTDRAILHSLLGVSIGDPSYNPRCDLNLDGDIDAADMAIFNTIPCNANWDCSTTAPVLNVGDFSAFANSFAASDPVADVNGDGYLNVLDYNAFSNAYAVGCY
jgi:hypothetical protein